MGNMTNDMTRLRGEVDALRNARSVLMQDLARGAGDLSSTVSDLRADFAAAHKAMAEKTGEERKDFVVDMVHEVNSLLDDSSKLRGYQALKGSHERGASLSEMRRQVSDIRKDTANDIKGARLAWRGRLPLKHAQPMPPPPEKEKAGLPKARVTKPAVHSPALTNQKKKNRLGEKSAKAAKKANRGTS